MPVMQPRLPRSDAVRERLQTVDAAGWYTNFGPQEVELRQRFATFLDVSADRVATASSASLALQGAATMSRATSWVVPSFTFPATVSALLQAGHEISFGDIRPEDWWLDLDHSAVDGPTQGIVPVAPFGAEVDLSRWDPSREVIIDAAASLGTDLPSLRELPATWAVVFSLHATKCLPAGEGGLVVFGDPERAARFRTWTNHGLADSRQAQFIATNAKLSEVAAVYAHAALDDWLRIRDEWLTARVRVERLEQIHDLVGQPGPRVGVSPYWIVVLADAATALAVERGMTRHGIGTRRWWCPGCHDMPAFTGYRRSPLPVTESATSRSLGLPMFRDMDDEDTERLSAALDDVEELRRC